MFLLPKGKKKALCEKMDMLVNLIVVIISHCIHMSKHVVHLKFFSIIPQ